MPIKPENKALYPKNWREIRAAILERAAHRCEQCGVPNHETGQRDIHGKWRDELEIHHMNSTDGMYAYGTDFPKMTKIVLTIAHLDHNPANSAPDNLKALCQRCHLAYDLELHQANARETRRKNKVAAIAATGQLAIDV